MGLADLKKSSTQSNRGQAHVSPHQEVNIEDFIDEATHYAAGFKNTDQGMAEVITLASIVNQQPQQATNKIKAQSAKAVTQIRKGNEPYRKATFTLSESAISHLAELASGCDVAKSKLIRFLIEHHFSLTDDERKIKERSIIVD
ncbi:CopG family transcriptional regulator [Shewanella nanhaiensis]|uniref:CopG family transcriptional regulator n=1 Tax=Shewanella nanhaiensis TaxID=2864872 RepID=A0ABS7EAZ3_9GAMM|nr:CopG family transcriptional regulator [Shewanella nanhaiensis]MBW8186222.1 CopG family transcriptional regulator [Shewanella nanhaiensis]